MADKTTGELKSVAVGDLTAAPDIYDDFKMPGEMQGEAVHATGAQMKAYAVASVSPLADAAAASAAEAAAEAEAAKASAATAEGAKTAAQSALASVQKALDNIPAGGTLVINDLTTGGASAALSAEMGKALGRRPNPNLLHGWYFANAVNQRGSTEYTKAGYTADRWKMTYWNATNPKTSISGAGITISTENETGVPNLIRLYQIIENPERLAGREVTLSVLLGDVTINSAGVYAAIYVDGSAFARTKITNTSADSLLFRTATLPDAVSSMFVCIEQDANSAGAGSVSINAIAMKLELGSVQTLAHQDSGGNWVLNEIPDYGEELAKCQRYYQLFSSADARPAALTDYRPTMRANPETGTIEIDGVTYYYADANL